MASHSVTDASLLEILAKLEPGDTLDHSLRNLLIKKIRNDLAKYQLMDQKFRQMYGIDFWSFKTTDQMQRPDFKVEQDYCDWEMAITLIDEAEENLKMLQAK